MRYSKTIYEILNKINFNIEDYDQRQLNDMERQKFKKAFRKNINKKTKYKKIGVSAAALILSMFIFSQTSIGQNVYAIAESGISQISYSIGKSLGIKKSIDSYTKAIGKIETNNGIDVKLDEVMIDKDRIIFSTVFNTKQPVKDAFFKNVRVYINDKEIDHSSSKIRSGSLDDTNTLFWSLCEYEIVGIEQKGDMKIKLVLEDLQYYYENSSEEVKNAEMKIVLEDMQYNQYEDSSEKQKETIKGNWEFEFSANGKDLAVETKAAPIDYTFKIDNHIYKLEKLEYNPIMQTIIGKQEIVGEYKESYFIQLKGYDNLGNQIMFIIKSATQDEVVFSHENIFPFLDDWSNKITSITLAPFVGSEQLGEEFTITLKYN